MFPQGRVGYPAEKQGRGTRLLVDLAGDGHVTRVMHHVAVLSQERRRVNANVVLAKQRLAILKIKVLLRHTTLSLICRDSAYLIHSS